MSAHIPFLCFAPSRGLQLPCIFLESESYHAYGHSLNRYDQQSFVRTSTEGEISLPSRLYTWTMKNLAILQVAFCGKMLALLVYKGPHTLHQSNKTSYELQPHINLDGQ